MMQWVEIFIDRVSRTIPVSEIVALLPVIYIRPIGSSGGEVTFSDGTKLLYTSREG